MSGELAISSQMPPRSLQTVRQIAIGWNNALYLVNSDGTDQRKIARIARNRIVHSMVA